MTRRKPLEEPLSPASRFEIPATADRLGLGGGPFTSWPRSLRLTFVSRGNLIRALSARKRATNDDPASSEKIHERGDDAVKRRISTFLSVRIFNPLVRA